MCGSFARKGFLVSYLVNGQKRLATAFGLGGCGPVLPVASAQPKEEEEEEEEEEALKQDITMLVQGVGQPALGYNETASLGFLAADTVEVLAESSPPETHAHSGSNTLQVFHNIDSTTS